MAFPEVCVADNTTCPATIPAISVYQYTNVTVEVVLVDSCGEPIDLSQYEFACFLARDSYGMAPLYINTKAELTDDNRLKLTLTEKQLVRAGIFLGEFVLFTSESADPVKDSSDSASGSFFECSNSSGFPTDLIARARFPANLMVSQSLAQANGGSNGLTIAEIRYALMDRCPVDNFLLDNVEFEDDQILWAIRRPVQQWNETAPILRKYTYTDSNFPYRYYWVDAVISELLRLAAYNYSRNNLRYQAAGVSVDDKDKAQEYMEFSRELSKKWMEWVKQTKFAINASQAWGTTFIPVYGYLPGANNFQGISSPGIAVTGPSGTTQRIIEPNCCD